MLPVAINAQGKHFRSASRAIKMVLLAQAIHLKLDSLPLQKAPAEAIRYDLATLFQNKYL